MQYQITLSNIYVYLEKETCNILKELVNDRISITGMFKDMQSAKVWN